MQSPDSGMIHASHGNDPALFTDLYEINMLRSYMEQYLVASPAWTPRRASSLRAWSGWGETPEHWDLKGDYIR